MLLKRKHSAGELGQLLAEIQDRLRNTNNFSGKSLHRFIDLLRMADEDDRTRVLFESTRELCVILSSPDAQAHLAHFLGCYRRMVEEATYSWSYAETIADNMKMLFHAPAVDASDKVLALEIAIIAAVRQNRFAAMETCRAMIISVRDGGLGMRIAEMLSTHLASFVGDIEPSSVNTVAIRALLFEYKKPKEKEPWEF